MTTDPTGEPTATLLDHDADGAQRIPVNVYETDEALVIVAPMPGVRADDVEIVVEADQLTMRAEVRATAPTKNYVMHEWEYGGYERSIPLPGVFHGDVTASIGNGQLAISISRSGEPRGSERRVVRPGPAHS